MELIDVLDENGIKTGEVLPRDEIHRQGLWHRGVVCAIINSDNQVLIQQRSLSRYKFPGLWDLSVAAHISAGEDAITALVRELNEEIGIIISKNIKIKDCYFISSFRNTHEIQDNRLGKITERIFYEFFLVRLNFDLSKCKFNDGEVMDVKWASYADILKLEKAHKLHPRTEWIKEIKKYIGEEYGN